MNESPSQRPPLRRQPRRSRPRRSSLARESATAGVIQLLSLCAAVAGGAETPATVAAALKGGGRHSTWNWKTAATAAAEASTFRVQCPATAVREIHNRNNPGVLVPLRETRGCWTTLLRGGSSAPDESGESGTTRDRPWDLHRSLPRRGGAWFTGYSDTTEEETSEEETTEGGDADFSEERSDGVIAEGGEGGRNASRRESFEGAGSDEKGLHGVEGISTNGFNSPVAGSLEKKSEAKALDEGKDKRESNDGEDTFGGEDDGDVTSTGEDTSTGAVVGRPTDVYARTIARRRAFSATLKVLQKALLRTALSLVAFQVLPWLKHNVIAQWLLLGSIFLQAASEVGAIISFFAGGAGGGRQQPSGETDGEEESSAGAGRGAADALPPSAGLVGGLMRVISPEHEKKQHLDFERLNDYFDKDSEALVVAGRTKTDVAALLAAGAAEDTRLFGASVLRAVKGLTGSYSSNNSYSSGRTSGKGRKKKKRTKNPKSNARSSSTDSSCSTGTLLEKKESADPSEETKPSARAAEADGESVESRPEPDGAGQEMTGPSNGSKTGDGSAGGAVETPRGNATAGADGGVGVSDKTKRVFVVKFGSKSGGSGTSANPEMELLSGAVSFLIAKGNTTTDEMVVCLESGGGEVSEFGLGAAKLARLREKGFRLTVCVDKIAASGGYMMACVADWVIAAPFAMLGSIGVVGGIPNFNKALRKAGIEYFHFTSGQQKSLVGPFQEVTRANQAMQQSQLDSVHSAFKRHVRRYRPSVNVEEVGTGEVWLGLDAAKHRLIDEVGTTMQYLEARMADSQVFVVKPHTPKGVRGSSLLRLLLLGPLAAVGRFASSLSTAAAFLQESQRWDRRGRSFALGDLLSQPPFPSWGGHGMVPSSDMPDVANGPGRSCDPSLAALASSAGLGGNSLLSGAKGWGAGPSLNPAVVEGRQSATEGDSGPIVFSL